MSLELKHKIKFWVVMHSEVDCYPCCPNHCTDIWEASLYLAGHRMVGTGETLETAYMDLAESIYSTDQHRKAFVDVYS